MANQNNLTYSIFENVGNHEEEDVVEYAINAAIKRTGREMSKKIILLNQVMMIIVIASQL